VSAPAGGDQTPFALLGLPASRELTDDDVRAAWRRIAAATHPDRADGGDPERFALASAAYTALRTRYGRGEALADLAGHQAPAGQPGAVSAPPGAAPPGAAIPAGAGPPDRTAPAPAAVLPSGGRAGRLFWRIRRGRPGVLALRAGIAAAVGAVSVAAAGFGPSALALITGAATWVALTARNDLAPPGPG
jgi:curved DNA-binding protein CbpA